METTLNWIQANFPALLVIIAILYAVWLLLRQYQGLRRDLELSIEKEVKAQLAGLAGQVTDASAEAKRSLADINQVFKDAREANQEAAEALVGRIKDAEDEQTNLETRLKGILESIPEDLVWLSPRALVLRAMSSNTWAEAAPLLRAVLNDQNAASLDLETAGDEARKRDARELALQLYRRAVDVDPERVSAKVELNALTTEWRPGPPREKAIKDLEILVLDNLFDPNTISYVQRFYNVLIEIDRYKYMVDFSDKVLTEKGNLLPTTAKAHVLRNRAVGLRHMGKIDEVHQAYETAYTTLPGDGNIIRAYAAFLYDEGNLERAAKLYKEAMLADPLEAVHPLRLADIELKRRNDSFAQQWLALADTMDPEPHMQAAIARRRKEADALRQVCTMLNQNTTLQDEGEEHVDSSEH